MVTKRAAISRAIVSIGATMALVVGVTFANLGSTATLTSNTLSTASADLQINTTGAFGSTAQGNSWTNVVPGNDTLPFLFDLKNNGGVNLGVTAHVPVVPTYSNFTDFAKVHVKINRLDDSNVVTTTLANLINSNVAVETINAGVTSNYKLVIKVDTDAVTGTQATIDNFDVVFTGTQP